MLTLNSLAIGAASLFAVVAANHGHDLNARSHHHDVVERSEHMNTYQKRFSGTGTYYITGLGACGIYNNPSDKIVALNSAQFGGGYPGPNCFKMITICKGSNCHPAQITDECPTCDYGSLDLSQSLFQLFASTDDGVFPMTWSFNDGASDDPPKTTSTKQADPPKTTKAPEPETTKQPEPTTTWEPPTTTSTKKRTTTSSPPPETTSTPEPTTSKTSSTPEPTSTSEAKSSTSSTPTVVSTTPAPSTTVDTSSAAPTATATTTVSPSTGSGSSSGSSGGSNLADANQIMLALGKMAVVANGGQ